MTILTGVLVTPGSGDRHLVLHDSHGGTAPLAPRWTCTRCGKYLGRKSPGINNACHISSPARNVPSDELVVVWNERVDRLSIARVTLALARTEGMMSHVSPVWCYGTQFGIDQIAPPQLIGINTLGQSCWRQEYRPSKTDRGGGSGNHPVSVPALLDEFTGPSELLSAWALAVCYAARMPGTKVTLLTKTVKETVTTQTVESEIDA